MAAVRYLPLDFDHARWDQSALDLVYELCPDWKEGQGEVGFVKFTDGITNTLIKATKQWPGKTKSDIDREAILMRAYGTGTDVLIDRERELNAHVLLASHRLAPPLLARFKNGLMYKFTEGDVSTPDDLQRPEVYRQVAKKLGEWHGRLPIEAISGFTDRPGEHDAVGVRGARENPLRPAPNTWTVMQAWIGALPTATAEEKERQQVLGRELAWLEDKLGQTPGIDGRDYVFGHCDLLSGNVIMQPQSHLNGAVNGMAKAREVSFIDYEYAAPSPAAFDIANHFAEWGGFECDYTKLPTTSQRRDFLQHYVASYRMHSIKDGTRARDVVSEGDDVELLFGQIDNFRGVPGFYWGIWALIQTLISHIDFDYASYAEVRLGEYWAWKAELDGSRQREGREMPPRERRWAEE